VEIGRDDWAVPEPVTGGLSTTTHIKEKRMTRIFVVQLASFAAAVVMTFATFVGAGAIAGDAYRMASMAQLQSQAGSVAAVQHVIVVGHRHGRA
jgi:hypothetical protein